MTDAAQYVVQLGDYKTLPLYSMKVKLDEDLPALSKGKATVHYVDPDYKPPSYPPTADVLNELGRDHEKALSAIRRWPSHLSSFMYYVQFRDDEDRTLITSLSQHTTTLSTLCDARLKLDPTPLWLDFDSLFSFAAVQAEYRADPEKDEKWDYYAQRLKDVQDQNDKATGHSTIRLIERMKKQVEIQSARWNQLPEIHAIAEIDQPALSPVKLFYSYSHRDENKRDRLETHLSVLRNQGVISTWHDRRITGGREWEDQIDSHLEDASLILLLISADFLASEYCYGKELRRAMERHESKEARVLPVILRDCDWHPAPFGKLQALPKDGKPITSWSNQDAAFTDVAKGVRSVVSELLGSEG